MQRNNIQILICGNTFISKDPRVKKQIEILSQKFSVTVIGKGKLTNSSFKFIELTSRPRKHSLLSRARFIVDALIFPLRAYSKTSQGKELINLISSGPEWDIILANDTTFIAAFCAKKYNTKLIYDAHEYLPEWGDSIKYKLFLKPYYKRIMKKILPTLDGCITVSAGIANKLNDFGVKNIEIIYNCPKRHAFDSNISFSKSPSKQGEFSLVHHGAAKRKRNIHLIIKLMTLLNKKYVLHLYLVVVDRDYYQELQQLAENLGVRVFFHDAVPQDKIVSTIAQHDIGIILYKNTSLNFKYCMPNKLFDFVQAGLAVFSFPSEDISRFVNQNAIGVISKKFSLKSMAYELNNLSVEKLLKFKINSFNVSDKYTESVAGQQYLQEVNRVLLED